MAPACPPDVFARFPACYEEGGRGRWPGWVLIRDGGGEGGWLGRMRVTRDSVSVLIDPRRGREKGETERRVTEEGAALEGGFLDRNGTVPSMDCGLGSV